MAGRVRIAATASGVGLAELVKRYRTDAAAAVKAGVAGAQAGMVLAMRQEIGAAFPASRRLPTAITGDVFPKADVSLSAAAWVRPRTRKVGAQLATFVEGAAIAPRVAGTVLAVPTAAVPRVSGRKMTPDEVQRRYGRRLDLVPPKPGGGSRSWGALVMRSFVRVGKARRRVRAATARDKAKGRSESVVMFILIPLAQMPKRLSPERIAAEWAGRVPELIARAAARLGL